MSSYFSALSLFAIVIVLMISGTKLQSFFYTAICLAEKVLKNYSSLNASVILVLIILMVGMAVPMRTVHNIIR